MVDGRRPISEGTRRLMRLGPTLPLGSEVLALRVLRRALIHFQVEMVEQRERIQRDDRDLFLALIGDDPRFERLRRYLSDGPWPWGATG